MNELRYSYNSTIPKLGLDVLSDDVPKQSFGGVSCEGNWVEDIWCTTNYHIQDLSSVCPSVVDATIPIAIDNPWCSRITQDISPVQNQLHKIESMYQFSIVILWFTTTPRKEKGNSVSIEFSLNIKTVLHQSFIPRRCCNHVVHSLPKIATSWCKVPQTGEALVYKFHASQFMCHNERQIIILGEISQCDICNTIYCIGVIRVSLMSNSWVIVKMNSVIQPFYLISIEVRKWLVFFALGKERVGVIFC